MERVALVGEDGRELSWLILLCQRIHIGRATVRAGIVGHVFTPEEHRKKGYGRVVMLATLDAMAQRGYEIGFLFGIPHYYLKHGYSVVEHYYATVLELGRCKVEEVSGLKSDRYCPADLPGVMRLYDSYSRRRTGAFVRDRDLWSLESSRKALERCLCVKNSGGKVVGYAKWDGKFFYTRLIGRDCMERMLVVPEAVGANARAAQGLLFALAGVARAEGRDGILFLGPPDNALSIAMYNLGGQNRRAIVPSGGAQAKIVNLIPLLKKLRGDFSARCEGSIFRREPISVRVGTDMGPVDLSAIGGKVRVAPGRGRKFDWKVTAQELIRYIFGFCPPPELPGAKGLFLKTIFPRQIAHSWAPDEMI